MMAMAIMNARWQNVINVVHGNNLVLPNCRGENPAIAMIDVCQSFSTDMLPLAGIVPYVLVKAFVGKLTIVAAESEVSTWVKNAICQPAQTWVCKLQYILSPFLKKESRDER
jgi:hypothetical protein